MPRTPSIILVTASMLFSVNVLAAELLRKSFLEEAFSTSFLEWQNSLKESREMGDATVAVNGTYNWTKLSLTSVGILKVTPDYLPNQLNRPNVLFVSVEENKSRGEKTLKQTDEELLVMVSSYREEMLPEFSVTTIVDLVEDVSRFHFTIHEVGRYPHIDRVAIETDGCWQNCIRR